MKIKASITLDQSLLEQVDKNAEDGNRSKFIEQALYQYLEYLKRLKRDQKDLEILNRAADRLNAEAKDALRYQVDL